MRLSGTRRCVALVGVVGIAISGVLAPNLGAQEQLVALPTLTELQGLSYESSGVGEVRSPRLGHDDLRKVVQTFESYRRGVQRQREYREPILTRGTQGMGVFTQAAPAIVLVNTAVYDAGAETAQEQAASLELVSEGTGVIIEASGLVLTNWHVIEDFEWAIIFLKPPANVIAEDYVMAWSNGLLAEVVHQDSTTDLALLRIVELPSETKLPTLSVFSTSSPEIAQDIHVIGHPLGSLLPWSYTTGVVSQIRENYTWTYDDGSNHQATVVQIQTSVNPGNSGGPLLDDNGQVVGLITASQAGAEQVHFAIAPNVIQDFLDGSQSGSVRRRGVANNAPNDRTAQVSQASYGAQQVIKSSYGDLTTYFVVGATGEPVGLLIEAPGRETVVTAWQPTISAGYVNWALLSADGDTLAEATGDSGVPTRFSAPEGGTR